MVSLRSGFHVSSSGFGKRVIELNKSKFFLQSDATLPGRAYKMCDLNTVFILGLASSFATNIVVLIYGLISEQTIFQSDASIVTISMVIFYWQARFGY